jgi:hypothetical protein
MAYFGNGLVHRWGELRLHALIEVRMDLLRAVKRQRASRSLVRFTFLKCHAISEPDSVAVTRQTS